MPTRNLPPPPQRQPEPEPEPEEERKKKKKRLLLQAYQQEISHQHQKQKQKNQKQSTTATAEYDYEKDEDNEIGFSEGDLIIDIEFVDDDWWQGKHAKTGEVGLFPATYVSLNEKLLTKKRKPQLQLQRHHYLLEKKHKQHQHYQVDQSKTRIKNCYS